MEGVSKWKKQTHLDSNKNMISILKTIEYEDSKIIGDSLTVLNIWMKNNNLTKIYIHMTNLIIDKFQDKTQEINVNDNKKLIFFIPAWADCSTYLEQHEYNIHVKSMEEKMRLILASKEQSENINVLLGYQNLHKTQTSLYYNNAIWNSFTFDTLENSKEFRDSSSKNKILTIMNEEDNNTDVLIYIKRANYDGAEIIDFNEGFLNIDSIRIYFKNIDGWCRFGNYENNRELFIKFINDLSFLNILCMTKSNSKIKTASIKISDLKKLIDLKRPHYNIEYIPIIKNEYNLQKYNPNLYIDSSNSILCPLDIICITNDMHENINHSNLSNDSCKKNTLIMKYIDGYPFYVFNNELEIDSLPSHLRSIGIKFKTNL